jgi:O6-methylguanine-DNA--protein-cysteine methyltransferase
MRTRLARIYRRLPIAYTRGTRRPRRAARCSAISQGKLQAIEEIPVQTGGTPFQSNVWRALRKIPRWDDAELRAHGQR